MAFETFQIPYEQTPLLTGYISNTSDTDKIYTEDELNAFANAHRQANWDEKGNIYYTNLNGEVVEQPKMPLGERIFGNANLLKNNFTNYLNVENHGGNTPNERLAREKEKHAIMLATLPFGGMAAEGLGLTGLARPFLAGTVDGGIYGLSSGLIDKKDAKGVIGDTLFNAALGGTLGLAGGKIAQNFTKGKLDLANKFRQLGLEELSDGTKIADLNEQYFNNYVQPLYNIDENLKRLPLLNRISLSSQPLQEYRTLAQGLGSPSGKGRIEHLFIGENAQGIDNQALNTAKNMFQQGADNESIRQATGWFKGVDDKWRYEIPDGTFNKNIDWTRLNDEQSAIKLKDIYNDQNLYSAYPQLEEIDVVRQPLSSYNIDGTVYKYKDNDKMGILLDNELFRNSEYNLWRDKIDDIYKTPEGSKWYKADEDWWNNRISNEEYQNITDEFYNTEQGKLFDHLRKNEPKGFVSVDSINERGRKTLVHELQHLLQDIEGFANGGNQLNKNYGNLAGEVESRLVEARHNLTPEQRLSTAINYDVPKEKQIVEFGNKNAAKSLNYRNEWVKIDGKDYQILNLPKKDYGKIIHIADTYIKPEDMIGEVIRKTDDMYEYTFQKVSPTDYKFIGRKKLK